MRRAVTLIVLLFLSPHSAAAQRMTCGGHFVSDVGGLPRMGLAAGDAFRGVEPTIPEPAEWTTRDRELWDALIFNGFDSWEGVPEQVTLAITPARLASINICQQGPDVSAVGGLMESYGRAWWRERIRAWTGHSWSGEFVVGDCSGEPEDGWLHVRAGDENWDVFGIAYAHTWRDFSSGTPHWEKAEIVIWPEYPGDAMDVLLTHELGHVMGFWHVPDGLGLVMSGDAGFVTPKERELANLAYRVGPGVQYPGLVRDDLPPDDVERAERAALTALYDATDGRNWRSNKHWETNAPLSSWHGVRTDDASRVTWLWLPSNNLTGRLPPELGDLTNLALSVQPTQLRHAPVGVDRTGPADQIRGDAQRIWVPDGRYQRVSESGQECQHPRCRGEQQSPVRRRRGHFSADHCGATRTCKGCRK